jgi:large subunit ribosomal protein L23
MADLKYYDIILRPVVTEKSMAGMADKKYVFYVHPDATKNQIREAVEKMFDGTKVEKVNTMNQQGKLRRTRTMKYGRTAARKKAIVKLTPESKEIVVFQGM